ncbi:anion transporter [Geodermatophilus dictyosporus]|uniref:Sodium-dependent dicarboxylate transporter SdcS n=1 Tax=Geodermatophilus dictyosporus TaxID=1523247 RepID=A0A1I5R2T2_9ACTN|nr:SLC13 family permease [Geodermatophilus dictyosporus]SFP52864.1 anion transporter [Geodermatophilus dictyosporus]
MPHPTVLELSSRTTPAGHRLVASRPAPTPPPGPRRPAWAAAAVRPVAAVVAVGVGVLLLPADLPGEAKGALFAFALAIVLWSTTGLPAAWVALLAVLVLVALGGAGQDALFESLASDVVWLMVGAFVLGGAITTTGLAGRLTGLVARRARTVGGVLWSVSVLLLPLALLIPSTSGRAAVVLPVYRSLSRAAGDRSVSRALALLVPSVILVTTVSTLVGAGSHLIANDLLAGVAGERISFAEWALYGVPFGLAAALVTCLAVSRLFLTRATRALPLVVPTGPRAGWSRPERRTVAVTLAMVGLWVSESVHGIEVATVAVAGAVALTAPGIGVLPWKAGVKAVEWNLVVFVGAALVLGEALIDTGAAEWIVQRLFAVSGIAEAGSELFVLVVLTVLTLTSHVYMTSHAARAAALVPALLYLGSSLGLDPVAVVFIGTVGMDYCLTFPVSSKALLLYAELDEDTFEPPDLLRLSALLLPAHVALVVLFALTYWPLVGLTL